MPPIIRRALFVVFLLIAARPVLAQFETSSIVGTVRDTTAAVVPEATITVTNVATGISVATPTNQDGSYEFFTVRAGTYLVTAEKSGFSLAVVDKRRGSVGARFRVDRR